MYVRVRKSQDQEDPMRSELTRPWIDPTHVQQMQQPKANA